MTATAAELGVAAGPGERDEAAVASARKGGEERERAVGCNDDGARVAVWGNSGRSAAVTPVSAVSMQRTTALWWVSNKVTKRVILIL